MIEEFDEAALISRAEQIKPQSKKIEGFEYQEELTEFHSKNKTGVWIIPSNSSLHKKGFVAVDVHNPDEIDLSFLDSSETKKVSRKTLVEGIVRPRLNEIFGMIKIQLDKEGLGTRVPSGVVLTGGGAETVGALESAKRMLSLPVRVGTPSGLGGLIDDIMYPSYATAVGLILFGASSETDETMGSISKRFKIPGKGGNTANTAGNVVQKIIQTIKDLLP